MYLCDTHDMTIDFGVLKNADTAGSDLEACCSGCGSASNIGLESLTYAMNQAHFTWVQYESREII